MSYATLSEAETELQVDLQRRASWAGLDAGDKEVYLVAATQRLDGLPWAGERASATQSMAFPRTGLSPAPSADIPPELARATSILAGDLAIDESGKSAARVDDSDVQTHAQGPISTTYFARRQRRGVDTVAIPSVTALEIIRQWLTSRITREGAQSFGTGDPSEFEPLDMYARTIGAP